IKKNWFPSVNVKIYDLGLHPYHVLKYKKFITERRASVNQTPELSEYTPKEQRWFKDGYIAELTFIHPVKFIHMLQYLIGYYKEKGDKGFKQEADKAFLAAIGA